MAPTLPSENSVNYKVETGPETFGRALARGSGESLVQYMAPTLSSETSFNYRMGSKGNDPFRYMAPKRSELIAFGWSPPGGKQRETGQGEKLSSGSSKCYLAPGRTSTCANSLNYWAKERPTTFGHRHMVSMAEGANCQEAKGVKLTALGYGYMALEEEVRESGCPRSRVEAERKPQRERKRPTSWYGAASSRIRGVTFGKDADVGGLATGSSDSSQGAVPKDRDAILRAARVNVGEAGRGIARVDLERCTSALRELEVLFPTAESEEQFRGKLAGCVIREANLGERENEVELERRDEAKSSPENSDSEKGAVGGAPSRESSGEPPTLGKKMIRR